MAEQPKDSKQEGITRRNFLIVGAGAGVAGLVVGGVGATQLAPKTAAPEVIPLPTTWIGRNFAACTGCRNCEIACSQKHENGQIWLSASRIQVYEVTPGLEFPVTCYQCDEARCVTACPEGALSVDPANSTILVDEKKCLRTAKNGECVECADACPGVTIMFHPTSSAPLFCDLCGGDPECVKVCPEGALMKNGLKQAANSLDEIAAGMRKPYEVKAAAEGTASGEVARIFTGPATA